MPQRKPGSCLRAQIAEGRAAQLASESPDAPRIILPGSEEPKPLAAPQGLVLPELTRQQRAQLERETDKLCSRVLRVEHAWNQQRQQIAKLFEQVRPRLRRLLGRPVELGECRDLIEEWRTLRGIGPDAPMGAEENTDDN